MLGDFGKREKRWNNGGRKEKKKNGVVVKKQKYNRWAQGYNVLSPLTLENT